MEDVNVSKESNEANIYMFVLIIVIKRMAKVQRQ